VFSIDEIKFFRPRPFDRGEKQYQTYSRNIKVLVEDNSKEPIVENEAKFTADLLRAARYSVYGHLSRCSRARQAHNDGTGNTHFFLI
jgi:hypothetical protein